MFVHLFSYRLKCLLRNRDLVFWTLLFPLFLATLFYFAFGHLGSEQEKFEPVPVVVESRVYQEEQGLQQILEILSTEGEGRLLDLTVAGAAEAEGLLEKGAVAGIIIGGETIGLTVKGPGLRQSILKAILDEYAHTTQTVTGLLIKNPQAAQQLFKDLETRRGYTESLFFSGASPDTMLGHFYALIAMACLYSAFWGLQNAIDLQADLSARGARRSVASAHKLKLVLSDTLAAMALSYFGILILLAYLVLVLKISFGQQLGYVLLICLAGVSFGSFTGTFVRGNEGVKVGFLIGVSMIMCFLAGLMWVDLKYIIATQVPFLSFINPAALIADAFYSLYTYATLRRFWINIVLLILLSAVIAGLSFLRLRRERYVSL